MKKIVIAPDSFKGSLSSVQVCDAVEKGIRVVLPELEIVKIPLADGGEGTVDAFLMAFGGKAVSVRVTGPCFTPVEARYALLDGGKTAVIEMAQASGLTLAVPGSTPMTTTTFGTGELIRHALDRGCEAIIAGIGGSATTDGGIGMAAALGVRFLDQRGELVPLTGAGLGQIHRIDASGLDPRLSRCRFTVACDVNNPLYGPTGAAHVFAPQKGADPAMVEVLDRHLRHYAGVLMQVMNMDVQAVPGSGAAGGLGAGLHVFAHARMMSGIDILLDKIGFEELLRDADLVITGEGRIDGQSLHGKLPVGVARRAKAMGVPVIAIAGDIGDGVEALREEGIQAIFNINRRTLGYPECAPFAGDFIQVTVADLFRLLRAVPPRNA